MALTPEEQAELAQLEGESKGAAAQPSSAGLSATEQAELAKLDSERPMTARLRESIPKYLQKAGQALDYVRGATTGPALAYGLEKLTGKDVYNDKERQGALSMTASYPEPGELLKRAGLQIPRGPSVSDYLPGAKGHWYDLSPGDVADFALTVGTDPLTYLSGGLSAVAKEGAAKGALPALARGVGLANEAGLNKAGRVANAVLNPIEGLQRARSRGLYQKAFEEVDRFAKQEGKAIAPSKILQDAKFSGGMTEAAEKLAEVNKQTGERIGSILDEASQKGATVPLMDAMQPAMDFASELRKKATPEAAALAKEIDDRILYAWQKTGGDMSAKEATELKSFVNQLIKDSGYAQGTEASLSTKAKKAISSDLAQGVEEAVKKVDPNLHKELLEANKLYGSTSPLVTDKVTQIGNRVAERRGPLDLTAVDLMLLGAGAGGAALNGQEPAGGAFGALLLKKGITGLTSTSGRTLRGKMADSIGRGSRGVLDSAARNTWSNIAREKEKEQ